MSFSSFSRWLGLFGACATLWSMPVGSPSPRGAPPRSACDTSCEAARDAAWMDPGILICPDSSVTSSMPTFTPQRRVDPGMVYPVLPPERKSPPRNAPDSSSR